MRQGANIKPAAIVRAAYEYQDLASIEVLIRHFRDPSLYAWVVLEAEDPLIKSLDDVVAMREDGGVDFGQVKFTVNADQYPLDWECASPWSDRQRSAADQSPPFSGLRGLPRGRLALPADHPLAFGRDPLSLDGIGQEPIILYPSEPRPSYAGQVLDLFRRHGVAPGAVREVRELQTALGLAAASWGLCIVPSAVQRLRRDDIAYRPLVEADALSPIILSWRSADSSPALALLRNICSRHPVARKERQATGMAGDFGAPELAALPAAGEAFAIGREADSISAVSSPQQREKMPER